MLLLPHIIQPCPPRALLRPLHHLDRPHRGAVHLDPHLRAHGADPVPQQHRRVHPAPPQREADTREGVACAEGAEEDVAYVWAVGVRWGEEPAAGGGWVDFGEV